MVNSTLLTDYVQRGTFAARPASPATPGTISAASTAFYYATDTAVLYLWTGAAWVIVGSGTGGGGAIVQDWNVEDSWASGVFIQPNDGRTVTALYTNGVDRSARAFVSHAAASGKFYFEFTPSIVTDTHFPIIGVGSATAALNNFVGNDVQGWGMGMGTLAWHNGATVGENAYVAGDVVGVAVDFTAGTGSIKFFKNNVAQTNAFTALTLGTMFPMVSLRGSQSNGKGKISLRAAEQAFAPPAGYSPWI